MGSATVNVRAASLLATCYLLKNHQVVRYTALFTGVAYGWYHRRTLQAAHDVHKIETATHQREHLIAQAKEAWRKKQEAPKTADCASPPPFLATAASALRFAAAFRVFKLTSLFSSTHHRPGGPAIRPRKVNCAMGGLRGRCIDCTMVLCAHVQYRFC
jgi:F-type H+-transporting ATP synthase subunit e